MNSFPTAAARIHRVASQRYGPCSKIIRAMQHHDGQRQGWPSLLHLPQQEDEGLVAPHQTKEPGGHRERGERGRTREEKQEEEKKVQ